MRQERIEIEDEAVGVVCPVYNAEMPMMVRDFMRKASIRTGYFFFVYTYGMGYREASCFRYCVTVMPVQFLKAREKAGCSL